MKKYNLILILILGSLISINNKMYACVPIYIEIASPVEYIDSDGYWKYNDKHGSSESDFLAVVTDGGPALNWVWTPGRYMVKGIPENDSYESVLPGVHTEHLGIYNYPIVSIGNVTAYSCGGSDTVNFVYCPIRCSIQCEEYNIGYGIGTDFTYTIAPLHWWSYIAAYFCIKDYWGNIVYVSEISGFGGTVEWDGMSNWDYNAEEFITPFALPAGYYYAGIRIFLKNKDDLEDYYIDDFPDIPENPSFILIEADLDADMDGDGYITYLNDSDDDLMEEDPGGYVGLNSDDDNDNGIADKDDGTVYGENDLVQIALWKGPSMNDGIVKLEESSSGSGDIAIWAYSEKYYNLIGEDLEWDLSYESLPSILYVEGITASSAPKDVELKLSYTDSYNNLIHEDKIKFTVVEVDMDMSGVDDKDETYNGGFIALNDDDDDDNHTADKNESGPVTDEDNLIDISLQKVKPFELTGNVTLKAKSGGSKVKIWEGSTKGGSPITLPKTYATPTALPKTLYVEGYNTSGDVRDIELALEYSVGGKTFDDRIKITVIDVVSIAVDASDTDSHKIASVLAAGQIPDDHFVTVQGLSGDITLIATISPDTTETKEQITWTNMSQDGTNKLKATKSRATSNPYPATVNVAGKDAKDLTNWVVWSNLVGIVQNPNITPILNGGLRVGTEICANYTCTATITPSEICDVTKDIPDLRGAKNCDPPGGTNVVGTPLSGGATLKWDMSRRISRQMNVNAANPALTLSGLDQNIAFPADNRIGNDDTHTGDENNDPYNSAPLGILTSMDPPTRSFALQGGNIGQTYENLTNFQEFARLNLVNSWYVISGSEDWSVQFRFIKVQVTEALWNVDANGDGDKLDNITEAMLGLDTNGDGDQNDAVGYWGNNASTSSN